MCVNTFDELMFTNLLFYLYIYVCSSEWNQWVTIRDVAHVTNGFKIEL